MEIETTELVPLALLVGELGLTRGELEARFAGVVERDDIGLACVPAAAVRQAIADRDAAEARQLEVERRRDAEAQAAWRPPQGVPAEPGLTAAESMMAAAAAAGEKRPFDNGRVSPTQELLDNIGRPVGGE